MTEAQRAELVRLIDLAAVDDGGPGFDHTLTAKMVRKARDILHLEGEGEYDD